MTDVSKTGLLAPSLACIDTLRSSRSDRLDVLVDACQFRLSPPTICTYLERGFMVAIIGSKFVTGPAFCGALLLPRAAASRIGNSPLHALSDSVCFERPEAWPAASAIEHATNFGLLLRWEAALSDLNDFRRVSGSTTQQILADWGSAVMDRIAKDAAFESLPVPELDRRTRPDSGTWDSLQTIFPFLIYRLAADGKRLPLCRAETALVHSQLQEALVAGASMSSAAETEATRFQLGQPVACGSRDGIPVSAMRICASARIVATAARSYEGTRSAIDQALMAFDKMALLVRRLDNTSKPGGKRR
jgi:hypothetical protein